MHCLKLVLLIAAVGAILVATAGPVLSQAVWDSGTEYSTHQNPSGTWTYGCIDKDGRFSPFNSTFEPVDGIVGWCMDDDPDRYGNVTINTTGNPIDMFDIVWDPGQICLHPGLRGSKVVLRWTSPVTGNVSLGANFSTRSKYGKPARVEVLRMGSSILQNAMDGFAGAGATKGARFGSIPELSLSPAIQVSRGDTIDIVVSDTGVKATGHVAVSITLAADARGATNSDESPKTDGPVEWNWPYGDCLSRLEAALDAVASLPSQPMRYVVVAEKG